MPAVPSALQSKFDERLRIRSIPDNLHEWQPFYGNLGSEGLNLYELVIKSLYMSFLSCNSFLHRLCCRPVEGVNHV